jgi:hypothetical protein
MSRRLLFTTIAAAGVMLGASLALAAGGCGIGYHPNPNGACVPNGRACPVGFHWAPALGHCVPN